MELLRRPSQVSSSNYSTSPIFPKLFQNFNVFDQMWGTRLNALLKMRPNVRYVNDEEVFFVRRLDKKDFLIIYKTTIGRISSIAFRCGPCIWSKTLEFWNPTWKRKNKKGLVLPVETQWKRLARA